MDDNRSGRRFEGARVVVTGGGRGIGREVALAFAREGARSVTVAARTSAQVEAVRAELLALGADARAHVLDVGDEDAARAVVEDVLAELGGIDVLVNAAGVFDLGETISFEAERTRRLMETNALGTMTMSRLVAPSMMAEGRGKIVNFTSLLSHTAFPGRAAYAASKAAVLALTRSLALEWARHGINVNAVTPGMIQIETPHPAIESGRLTHEDIVGRIPAGRRGHPRDVVGAVLFLAGPDSDYVHGHALVVDGGWLVNGYVS
ncbi:SDR family NAD(P)-dependent oxidoreductase [Streptomyces sp. KL2]|uniref:SDR family NAD(P)-dependent oxidoreductase n=1 Tax=Streptomyces sp. KL2 TaxID=3050126 RepID=UPI003979FDC3